VTSLALALAALASAAVSPLHPTPAPGTSAPGGTPLSGTRLDERTDEIGALLRCPVCQGLSVTDSPATMARNMKAEIREKLKAGYDQEQILADFEHSYGEFVRLEPPLRGVNWLVWFGPLAGLLAGGAMIVWTLKRSPQKAPDPDAPRAAPAASPVSDLPSRDALPADAHLAAAVRRVRTLAYGWPDGTSPKERS